ncbi:cyclic GMP-AMP synthase-like [Tachyglossus aculeatus]|uniref:cyclic GMP-AMP synthase-like n=1 Tax=Tachyglossus aculeatus TaxID=9261 RepID=UPI0018F3112D|nr:cyclic GMP-AMP synthase-like [Tachyglossus aculeatus]
MLGDGPALGNGAQECPGRGRRGRKSQNRMGIRGPPSKEEGGILTSGGSGARAPGPHIPAAPQGPGCALGTGGPPADSCSRAGLLRQVFWRLRGGGRRAAPHPAEAGEAVSSWTGRDPPDPGELVLGLVRHLVSFLRSCPTRASFHGLREPWAASAQELERVFRPNEFSLLLAVPLPAEASCGEVDGFGGLYYRVALDRPSRSFPSAFLLDDEATVSPGRLVQELRALLKLYLHSYTAPLPGWQLRLDRKKPNCPALTLGLLDQRPAQVFSLRLIPALDVSGCGAGRPGWPALEEWMGEPWPRLNKTPYLVAKQAPGRENKETWQISFFYLEKEILKRHNHSQTGREAASPCCQKDCLWLLRSLLESLKQAHPVELAPLDAFHAKTLALHRWRLAATGPPLAPAACFARLLGDFIGQVEQANLPHAFLPRCNLFAPKNFPPAKLRFLLERLRAQREAGLRGLRPVPAGATEAAPGPEPVADWGLFGLLLVLVLTSAAASFFLSL